MPAAPPDGAARVRRGLALRRPAAGPARLAAVLTGLVLVGPVLPATGAGLVDLDDPVGVAPDAARRVPFSARVEVSWVDQEGVLHTAELGVRTVGGEIRIQGPATTTGGVAGTLQRDTTLPAPPGQTAVELLTPAVERKYDVTRGDGPEVAGRPTDQVVLRSGGRIRERLAIDKATGLVLQREVFGDEGRPVRIVRVLQLETAPVPSGRADAARTTGAPRQLRVSSLPSAYPAPAFLAGGYQRVAAYRHSRLVQLVYTDGLHGLSLFSQPGELSARSLPRGGQPVTIGSGKGVHYTWPGGEVVTWQAGSMVHTLVGDATTEDLVAAARSLPRPKPASLLARVLGTARLVGEVVSGGR